MMMLVVLVAGAAFSLTLVREMFPESRPDKLMVAAVHPGVQPEELEKAVTIKLEEAVRDVEGVEQVDSTVSEGISTSIVTLFNDVDDVDVLMQEMQNQIDAVQDLPDDMEQVTIRKIEPQLPVISVAIFGDGGEGADPADRHRRLKRAARNLREELLQLPGVSKIQITGARGDEISVEVRPDKLLEYDITFDEIADAIRASNLDVSGGQLKGSRTSMAVRTLGELNRGVDLEELVVRNLADGRKLRLRDVAVIRDEFVESDLESYFNGKPGMNCVVYKNKSQDAIRIARVVKAYIRGKQNADYGLDDSFVTKFLQNIGVEPNTRAIYEASRGTPFQHGFDVALHTDLARFVEGRLDLMTRNGQVGLVLVLISLNLFLNWRVAWWAAVGLVVSFLGTFIVMWMYGASINLLSMFGLIIVLGIIVDDAIVIGENIYRHVEAGEPPMRAAIKGAEEVMWPVIIAVLTTMAAFAPLFFIRGQIGDFMAELPLVVIAALTVSLIEALIVLPAHLSRLPSKAQVEAKRRKLSSRDHRIHVWWNSVMQLQHRFMQHGVLDPYERFLRLALRWRYLTLAISVSLLIMTGGLVAGGIVENVMMQKMDSESLICNLEMPVGTTADRTRGVIEQINEFARPAATPEVLNIQSFVAQQYDLQGAGAMGSLNQSHLGQFVVELQTADAREAQGLRSSTEVVTEFREKSRKLAGINSVTWQEMNGGPGGRDIHIRVSGSNFAETREVVEKLKQELDNYEGVFDLDDDLDKGKREAQLRLRESARPTGITEAMLGHHVRAALFGREARRLTRNREDVKIMVRYPQFYRTSIHNLEAMRIPTPMLDGKRGWVPLGEVAGVTEADAYTSIQRSKFERSVTIFGNIDDEVANTGEILDKVQKVFDERIAPLHPTVKIELLGQFEETRKAFGSLTLAFPVALLLIYMLLAGLFRSYMQPLIVMLAIPFGLLGAIVGHWITGNPFTILSKIGMVALTGIIVNDSLVLVDFINRRIRDGVGDFEASVQGARLRLRAILLTTLTTAAGLTPLMFETSFQAKFLIPMAVTLTFGLIFATALTLVIVPTLNLIYLDIRQRFGGHPFQNRDQAFDELEEESMRGE
ncbi:MAG: efflux RND transporter permease subunit [Planctomycetota bacterium]|nr:efflux RND transporter permease subunit [Planctomycetota bacterium]